MTEHTTWTSGTNADDVRLSGLTPARTQRVRDLACATLRARGLEATVHADHLRLVDGRTFGLQNLASFCHNAPEVEWPRIVEGHLGGFLDRYPAAPPMLTPGQMRAGVHLRLVPADALASMGEDTREQHYRYARDLGGGWLEILTHLEDGHVRWLRDCEVEQVGAERLRELGRERLERIRPDICEEFRRPDGRIFSVRGESSYISSKVLVLPDVLRRALPRNGRAVPFGALVAMPTRHELLFTPVGRDVITNLGGLMSLVPDLHRHGRTPLCPHVHWWRDGRLDVLTEIRHGRYEMRAVAEFVDVLDALVPGTDAA